MPSAGLKVAAPNTAAAPATFEPHEPQFLRHGLTRNGLFESICFQCGRTVACSPDMCDLQMAEESHDCSSKPQRVK